jgi:hypothetical protein
MTKTTGCIAGGVFGTILTGIGIKILLSNPAEWLIFGAMVLVSGVLCGVANTVQ